jgi:hypothetical protein
MANSTSSIIGAVQVLIDQDLSLQDALQRGYGNYSAIARMLKPKVAEALGRDIKLESIVTAIKRSKKNYRLKRNETSKVIAKSTINIRTDINKITVRKADRSLMTIRRNLPDFLGEFLHVLEGVSVTTLIFDEKLSDKIDSLFSKDEVLDRRRNLAAIVMQSPTEIVDTPGCITSFYNQISRRHINIEEAVSCYSDTIILLDMKDINSAFMALTDLVAEARKTN